MLSATRWAFARAVLSSETDEIKEKRRPWASFFMGVARCRNCGRPEPPDCGLAGVSHAGSHASNGDHQRLLYVRIDRFAFRFLLT